MTLAELTTFLGWSTLINFGLLTAMGLGIATMGTWMKGIHSRMFALPGERLDVLYFDYLGRYKALVLVFNAVPYVALKIMG